jgi:CRP/FNR family cyclic AMP-dependent transcriptional regulator
VVVLSDGRRVATRRADARDRSAIVDLYQSLSPRSRYQRFFHPTPRLTPQLRHLLADLHNAEVWIAVDGDTCVGEARIVRHRDHSRADLAVTVADAYQHVGLGRNLARLAVVEQRRHLGAITVSILPDNTAAVRLASRFRVALHVDGGALEGRIAPRPALTAVPTAAGSSRRSNLTARPAVHLEEVSTMSKHDPKIEHLAEIGLFRRCTRRQLHEVARRTTELDAARGAILCWEGEIGRECFIIRHGQATVTIDGDEVATIGAGDFFGELALLDGAPRVATVTAATDMRLVVLSRPEFNELLAEVPIVARRILEAVGARLRAADTMLHARRLSA